MHQFKDELKKKKESLGVQGLGLGTFTAGAHVQSLFRELRSHQPCDIADLKKKMNESQTDSEVKPRHLHSRINDHGHWASVHRAVS